MRQMTLGSTHAKSRAVAPAAQRQQAETSCGRKPNEGPKWVMDSRMQSMSVTAVTLEAVLNMWAKGIVGGAACSRR
jgi:hypothetical protein